MSNAKKYYSRLIFTELFGNKKGAVFFLWNKV